MEASSTSSRYKSSRAKSLKKRNSSYSSHESSQNHSQNQEEKSSESEYSTQKIGKKRENAFRVQRKSTRNRRQRDPGVIIDPSQVRAFKTVKRKVKEAKKKLEEKEDEPESEGADFLNEDIKKCILLLKKNKDKEIYRKEKERQKKDQERMQKLQREKEARDSKKMNLIRQKLSHSKQAYISPIIPTAIKPSCGYTELDEFLPSNIGAERLNNIPAVSQMLCYIKKIEKQREMQLNPFLKYPQFYEDNPNRVINFHSTYEYTKRNYPEKLEKKKNRFKLKYNTPVLGSYICESDSHMHVNIAHFIRKHAEHTRKDILMDKYGQESSPNMDLEKNSYLLSPSSLNDIKKTKKQGEYRHRGSFSHYSMQPKFINPPASAPSFGNSSPVGEPKNQDTDKSLQCDKEIIEEKQPLKENQACRNGNEEKKSLKRYSYVI
ncbi:unnamed protein product [Moneuplotes crassus]|uniref:Uncharacterized protein n=1 Tax=Euplotes crassus TaxID=5936 RepID=A0AAD1X925_EUPCR|nr:unnamed protein product [Moneuplotes crassus]